MVSSFRFPRTLHSGVGRSLAMAAVLIGLLPSGSARAADGQLELRVLDKDTRQPIACRMTLTGANGKPRFPSKVTNWDDHFVVPGRVLLNLPLGVYTFEIERGPEYAAMSGHFTLSRYADDSKEVELPRHVDMSRKGWWSGDLDIRRAAKDIELLMAAEDLHVAPLVTWWNAPSQHAPSNPPTEAIRRLPENRLCDLLGGQSDAAGRDASPCCICRARSPLATPAADYPPVTQYLQQAKKHAGGVDRRHAALLVGPADAGLSGARRFGRGGPRRHVPQQDAAAQARQQAPRREVLRRPPGDRPMVARRVFPLAQLRAADPAQRGQRLGRRAQPGRLQSGLRPRRRPAEL